MSKIGLGIVTYNRPEYFNQTLEKVVKHLIPIIDVCVVYNDGSSVPYNYSSRQVKEITILHQPENKGVAYSKNRLLRTLMEANCDYLFLLEDDVYPKTPEAITRYIDAYKKTGIHHFNFAHHGPGNVEGPRKVFNEGIECYPQCVGAYSFYTRECIETVGYFDENFHNAFEHVEHTKRIANAGLTTPFWYFADVAGSEELLEEIPGSIDHSSIRSDPNWSKNIENALEYWKQKDGEGIPPLRPLQ